MKKQSGNEKGRCDMEKTIRDMERNGFMIVKAEKITTFIYTVIGKKIQ